MSVQSPMTSFQGLGPRASISDRVSPEPLVAAWRKMVGIALLWLGLAALAFVAGAGASLYPAWLVALVGFASFAAGLSLFAEGLKRSIVAAIACGAAAPASLDPAP